MSARPLSNPWYVLGVLILAYAVSFIDRQILSLMVEPLKADLNINDTQIGLLQGFAFAIFYTLLGVPIATLAERFGRVKTIAFGVTIWCFATAACGAARSFASLFAARIMVGVGEAALSPAAHSLITDYFPRRRMGLAHSLYAIAIPIGGGLALALGGLVVEAVSRGGGLSLPVLGVLAPWQAAFVIVGLPGLLLVPLLATIREPPRRVFAQAAPESAARGALARFLSARGALVFCYFGGMAALTLMAYANVAWIPSYFIRVHEWDRAQVGLAYGLTLGLFGAAGLIAGGWFADHWAARGRADAHLLTAIGAAALVIAPAILTPLMADPWASVALIAAMSFFGAIPTGCAATMTQIIAPPSLRGPLQALFLLCINLIGYGFGPVIVGVLNDHVFADPQAVGRSLSITVGCASIAGALLLACARGPYRRALQEHGDAQA